MPGKYLEYVKSGRYAVPVELSFLPSTCNDEIKGKEFTTTKWAERVHWKELKALLKPAVDSCTSANSDGLSKSPHISFGQELALGYVLSLDKDKSPFLAVLDSKKNCWTDDEDDFDQLDELAAGLRDYGGSHRNYPPTKVYVKACVMKRTTSGSNDSKKLKKELGFKGDDLRTYFQNASPSASSISHGLSSSLHDKEWKNSCNKRFGYGALGVGDGNKDRMRQFVSTLPGRGTMDHPPEPLWRLTNVNVGTYYEEQDDVEDSDEAGYQDLDPYNDDKLEMSDDDNFSLPDIDAPQTDIQQKQLKKEQAKEEKQKMKFLKHQQEKSGKRIQKWDSVGRPLNELEEKRKNISLLNPINDHFAQKIGAVSSPYISPSSNPVVKSSANYGELTKKPKKRNAPKEFPVNSTSPLSKKSKESRKLLQERKANANIMHSDISERGLQSESLKDKLRDTSPTKFKGFKLLNKRKPRKERAVTKDNVNPPITNDFDPTINSELSKSKYVSTKSKNATKDQSSVRTSKRLNKDSSSDVNENDTVTNPIQSDNNETQEIRIPLQTQSEEPVDTPPPKKRRKKLKNKQFVNSPQPTVQRVKKERAPNTVFHKATHVEPDEVDSLGLELDPDMPVLSPMTLDCEAEISTDNEDDVPALKPEPVSPLKPTIPKKKKVKKTVDKSTSTMENEPKQKLKFQTGKNSVPEDVNDTRPGKPGEILTEEDESTVEFGSQRLTEPQSMMPPPMRPAPRTPKKKQREKDQRSHFRHDWSVKMNFQGNGSKMTKSETSKLSTIQIMYNPSILRAGMGLLNNLSNKKMTATEVGQRLGFADIDNDTRKRRELSPDITSLPVPASANTKILKKGTGNSRKGEVGQGLRNSDEELSDNDSEIQEQGETLIRELLDRVHANNANNSHPYEPEGDEFDLSQRSMCYLNMIPGYSQKSRLFKIHCKNITDLNFEKLVELFIEIRPCLREIFEGQVSNTRSAMYLQGNPGKRRLQDMNVSIPFDHDQTSTVISLLLEYFIPDPKERPTWSDFVTYVLLPEALILIYSRVNEISYEIAEKEMRFQGCYDDSTPTMGQDGR